MGNLIESTVCFCEITFGKLGILKFHMITKLKETEQSACDTRIVVLNGPCWVADGRGGSVPPSLFIIYLDYDGVYLYMLRLCLWCQVNAPWMDKILGRRDVFVVRSPLHSSLCVKNTL